MAEPIKTAKQIVADANALARLFYSMHGCHVPEDYKFYEATHPQEVGCWNLAVVAYAEIEGTPVDECLAELMDKEGGGD